MEIAFRAALIAWLAADPALTAGLNAIVEEAPARTALPFLALTASASTDWSLKGLRGREIRVALEFTYRGDDPLAEAALVASIERRIETMPSDQTAAGFTIASLVFIRARAAQVVEARRSLLLDYRARVLEA